jgi:hypothetical protein
MAKSDYFDLVVMSIIAAIAEQLQLAGKLDVGQFVATIQEDAINQRAIGNVEMANALHDASQFFLKRLDDPIRTPPAKRPRASRRARPKQPPRRAVASPKRRKGRK